MRFTQTQIDGVWQIRLDRHEDDRGWFARSWCVREFEEHGINPRMVQCNLSYNKQRGTLRGMHFQAEPHTEDKYVRVNRGAIFDVAVDLRPDSPTYKHWQGFELSTANHTLLYLPKGIAHGFLTLADETEVMYLVSAFYVPDAGRGVRWNDPAFGIEWPFEPSVMVERDRTYEDFPG